MKQGGRRGAGREPEVGRGRRPSRRGRQVPTAFGAAAVVRAHFSDTMLQFLVSGAAEERAGAWPRALGGSGRPPSCRPGGAWAWVPQTLAPARRLSGWAVGVFVLPHSYPFTNIFLTPFKSLKLLRCQSIGVFSKVLYDGPRVLCVRSLCWLFNDFSALPPPA